VLFGDGAGAGSSRQQARKRFSPPTMRSDGKLADLLYRPDGGATTAMSADVLEKRSHLVRMAGPRGIQHAVASCRCRDRALDGARLTGSDIDLLIPHQDECSDHSSDGKASGIPNGQGLRDVDGMATFFGIYTIALNEAIESVGSRMDQR